MNLDNFNQDLDYSLDILEAADCLEDIGFTKKQARFINLLITQAIKQYDKQLNHIE